MSVANQPDGPDSPSQGSKSMHWSPKSLLTKLGVGILGLTLFSGSALANSSSGGSGCSSVSNDIESLESLLQFLVLLVATPNGLWGIIEWMTSGDSQEKVERGRKRIRRTFIGVAAAALLIGIIDIVQSQLFSGDPTSTSNCASSDGASSALADPEAVDAVATVVFHTPDILVAAF